MGKDSFNNKGKVSDFINYIKSSTLAQRIFILSLALGIIIRLIGLDFQSLWVDELYSVTTSNSNNLTALYNQFLIKDPHPPLYQVFLYLWVKLFGESVISVRLPSAIAGILSIYFLYKSMKEFLSEDIAVLSSILLAFSNAALYYSQETRSYSFMILFSIISTYYWLRIIYSGKSRTRDLVIYSLLSIITSYIHYFGLLIIIVQIVYWFVYTLVYKKSMKHPIWVIMVLVLTYSPWVIVMIDYVSKVGGGKFWIEVPTLSFFRSYYRLIFDPYYKFLLFFVPVFIDVRHHTKSLVSIIKSEFSFNYPLFAIVSLIIGTTMLALIISLHTPILTTRNLLCVAPFIYVILAIWVKCSVINKKQVLIYVLSSCILCSIIFLPGYYSKPHKQQWREAVLYVTENYDENSIIIAPEKAHKFNYYLRYYNFNKNKVVSDINGIHVTDVINFYDELKSLGINEIFILEANRFFVDDNMLNYYESVSQEYTQVVLTEARVNHFKF